MLAKIRAGLHRRRLLTGALIAAVALAFVAVGVGQASADVNRYTIQANSPKPSVCNNSGTIPAGTWLQNKPCGYAIGTALAGWSYDVQETSPSDYHYGRIHGGNDFCAWVPPGALSGSPTGTAPASCGAETREAQLHRKSFGHDFNAGANSEEDGSAIAVQAGCAAYYNYFNSSGLHGGSLRDAAGGAQGQVAYRYTANGGDIMMVRDGVLGWVFMSRSCVTDWQGVAFHNDDD